MTSSSKIICIGRNFQQHAKELNNAIPEQPVVFLKPFAALCPPDSPVKYPEFTANLQYECEIVLQISQKGKNIAEHEAAEYVGHWTVGLDLTARDIQQSLKARGLPWELAKSFDQSAVVGQLLPVDLRQTTATPFSLQLNEQTVQQGNTMDMIFSFAQIIHFVSRYFTLLPGDLLFTGTPEGVGRLQPGDQLTGFLNDVPLFSRSVI